MGEQKAEPQEHLNGKFEMYIQHQEATNQQVADAIDKLTQNQVELRLEVAPITEFMIWSKKLLATLVAAAVLGVCAMLWDLVVESKSRGALDQQLIQTLEKLAEKPKAID